MASTYSPNLAIELIATGEQAGTWSVTTNTNLGTLIEQSISGYVTQAITDGSGANTTITIPNGATGVARNMFIEMTGALTFSTTSLIVPANKKMYFIFNNTTGGFAVTVKVSGQTGILVPNGKKVILTSNGTDIVEAHTAIVGNATMGGTLGITGTTTAAAINASGTVAMAGAATVGTTLGVGGTLSAVAGEFSGVIHTASAATVPLLLDGATTGTSYMSLKNTSGVYIAGVASSTGGPIGAAAYDAFAGSNAAKPFHLLYNAGIIASVNSGGLAVTGTFSASGTSTMAAINASGVITSTAGSGAYGLFIKGGGTDDLIRFASGAAGTGGLIAATTYTQGALAKLTIDGSAITLGSGGAVTIPGAVTLSTSLTVSSTTTNTIGTTGNGGGSNLRLAGFSPNATNGSYGNLLFNANSNYSGGARRFLITNSYNVTDFAIIRSVDASTDPSLSGAGVVASGTVDFAISSAGAVTIPGTITLGTRLLATPSNFGYSSTYKALVIGSTGTDYTTNGVSICLNYDPSVNPAGTFQGDGTEILVRRNAKITVPNAANTTLTNVLTFLETGLSVTGSGAFNGSVTSMTLGSGLNSEATSVASIGMDSGATAFKIRMYSGGYYFPFSMTAAGAITVTGTLDVTGNVGVGVTPSPWNGIYKVLQVGTANVNSSTSYVNASFGSNYYRNGANSAVYISSDYASSYDQDNGTHSWSYAASGTAGNTFTFTQAMTLDASGNLLVGTTSTINSGMISVSGRITAKTTTAGSEALDLWNSATTGDNVFAQFSTEASITARGTITYNRAGGLTVYNTTSDYRLKEHIIDLPNALETVNKLKPRQFNWKETGNTTTGFIAHELAEVCPHAVTGEKDAVEMQQYEISPAVLATFDEEGNELTAAVEAVMGEREVPRYQGVDTSFLVAVLTKAIQELAANFQAYKSSHP